MEAPDRLVALFARPIDPRDEHVVRARALLERAIRQRWAEGTLARDGDSSYAAAIGSTEAERLMRLSASAPAELLGDHAYDPRGPIGELAIQLGLAPTEADLLAVLLACETDPATARLAAYLAGTPGTLALSIDTLFALIYRPRSASLLEASSLLHTDLAPERAARRLRFLLVDGADSRALLAQTVRLAPRITAWLLGRRALDAELAAHAALLPPDPPIEPPDPGRLELVARTLENGHQLVALRGPAGAGRELLLQAVAHLHGRPLLLVSGRGLEPPLVVAAFREAVLQDAILAFRDADDAFTGEGLLRLRDCLAAYPGTVALIGLDAVAHLVGALRPLIDVEVPIAPYAERLRLWRRHVGAAALTDAQWREVSGLYNLGTGGIVRAGARARDLAATEHAPVGRGHIARALRMMFDTDLATVARRAEVSQTWEDVVLPEDIVDSVRALTDRIAFRNEVLGEWGFARKVGKGLGLTALFSGPPGTGKSMVAGLIARELGLDLYVIDLSRIMSKWLGETEKNLARAFDAAEAGHVLLLFDEADTVLGKRTTSMQSANDRHANLETNFILARLEQFHGIAVFTTNIPSAVDEAVMRRMTAHINFPFPDIEARAELWRRMIPAETPLAGKIDFHRLARDFELTGGYIRNVVLRAAYLAARERKPLAAEHVERAARGEYGERGALSIGGRL